MDDQSKTELATEKTREVVHDAADQAKDVAATAREQAGAVGHEVTVQVGRVVDEAKRKLREQGEQQSTQLASTLRGWSDQARALADGRPEEAGQLSGYAQQAAGKVAEVAERVEARGVEGALDDMKSFARRRPGVFLLGAGIAGLAAGRLLRAAKTAPDATPGHAARGSVPYSLASDPPSVAPTPVGAIEGRGA